MSSSSAEEEEQFQDAQGGAGPAARDAGADGQPTISPLAMMSENSPESWLGQFLLQLDLSTARHTMAGAQEDAELVGKLEEIRQQSGRSQPLKLLDAAYSDELRARDWQTWWKAQDDLSNYSYATLALGLLGHRQYSGQLGVMYRQSANSRIHKDAHYVLCYLLSKPWPSYSVSENDLAKLEA